VTDLQRLVAAARPGPGAPGLATFRIDDEAEADRVLDGLIEYFGADRSRAEVRLVVDGEEVGYVGRADLYGRAIVLDRGVGGAGAPFGGSAGAGLPGMPTGGGAILVLRCPVPGCPEGPVYATSYDEDHPPRCATHTATALVMDAA
jgi:hypothetical protein